MGKGLSVLETNPTDWICSRLLDTAYSNRVDLASLVFLTTEGEQPPFRHPEHIKHHNPLVLKSAD